MRLNILLLCNKPKQGNDANTIVDHIEAIEKYSKNRIWLCSNIGHLSDKLDLDKFDVIIIHYSLSLLNDYYLSGKLKQRLREYKGLKVVFVQDEYRQINLMKSELNFLDIDVLFTCFPESEINKIYTDEELPRVSKYTNLTGYIPGRLIAKQDFVPIKKRNTHVGYRGRKVPYWLGELAYEKWSIVDKWFEHVTSKELKVDLSYSEKDRIYGDSWIKFLFSCKATLGVESGASVMDFTGELEKNIDLHQVLYSNDSFIEVQKKYLSIHEGKYKLNQISPRCFEAIALKTVLVLYEGEYSGILIPGRHYIMLKKDFSNIDEVTRYLHDDEYLQKIADQAYNEVALNHDYSYRAFIERVDQIIDSEFLQRKKIAVAEPYNEESYQSILKWMSLKNKFKNNAFGVYRNFPEWLRFVIKAVVRPRYGISSIRAFATQIYQKIVIKVNHS